MSDDLPVDMGGGTENGGDGEGWGLFEWLLAAGGGVAAIYILSWLFNILVWLTGYAVQAAVAILVLYAAYKGVEYLLGADESTGQAAVPDAEIEGELDEFSADGGLDAELGGVDELETTETEDVKLGDLPDGDADDELGMTKGVDLEDDDLEKKFEELEREMSEE